MRKQYILFLLLFIPFFVRAQVSGVVLNSEGTPLMGVVVQNSDGSISTTTDFDGYFELNVPEGTALEVIFLGYRTAKVSASPGMHIELRAKGAKPKLPSDQEQMPWSAFVLANGMAAFPFSPAVGLTVGMVRKGGWYVNFMTGFGFHFAADEVSNSGLVSHALPFYTDDCTKQTMSLTAGGLARLGKAPVYWYGGLGWGYKSITYKTNNDKWVAYSPTSQSENGWSPLHSAALETGIMANIKGFALSVGYEVLLGGNQYDEVIAAHEIKIGLGGMFNCKRRAQK